MNVVAADWLPTPHPAYGPPRSMPRGRLSPQGRGGDSPARAPPGGGNHSRSSPLVADVGRIVNPSHELIAITASPPSRPTQALSVDGAASRRGRSRGPPPAPFAIL